MISMIYGSKEVKGVIWRQSGLLSKGSIQGREMLVDSTDVLRNLIEHFVQLGSTGYRAAFECLVGGLCHVLTRSSRDYSVASFIIRQCDYWLD